MSSESATHDEITDEELDIALGWLPPAGEEEVHENKEEASSHYDDATMDQEEEYDFFATTAKRLKSKDPSLQTLEIFNPMDWDFDRWRDEYGRLDILAWFQSIAELLSLAQTSSYVERIELCHMMIHHIEGALMELLACDDRSWEIRVDECTGISPQFLCSLASTNLKSLHLTNNHLSPCCIEALGHLLMSSKSLMRLRITETMIPSSLCVFAQGLKENTKLVHLDFLGSTFHDIIARGPHSTIQAISAGLKANRGICTLSFSHCGLQDFQLESLVHALQCHPSLTWLDLSNNFCGAKTCDALVSLMSSADRNSTSKTTQITDAPVVSHLTGLSLIACGIQDDEAMRLGSVLNCNSTLKHLHLSENNISDEGMESFADSLKNTICSLKTLWMMENEFGDAGAMLLFEAIKTNVELEQLLLDRHLSCFDDIQYQILLNRGGRKFLTANAPLALWPLVFERAQTVRHYCRRAGPHDILYHLVRGPALLENPSLKD